MAGAMTVGAAGVTVKVGVGGGGQGTVCDAFAETLADVALTVWSPGRTVRDAEGSGEASLCVGRELGGHDSVVSNIDGRGWRKA